MGGRWIKWNGMTERWEYLWATHELIEQFTETWKKTATWMEDGQATASPTLAQRTI